MSPRPRCAVVASRTTDTEPLPHDRDCPQASLVLREQVQDSHHPTEGYLPSYLVVDASLQNSKSQKVLWYVAPTAYVYFVVYALFSYL
jgi:hypothetical protein